MPGFSITPVAAYPPTSSDGFPRFIQFQRDGVDVGTRAVENLNFTGPGVTGMTVNSAGSTVDVEIEGNPFAWVEAEGDYTLSLSDVDCGVATIGNTGAQMIVIPPESDVPWVAGAAVLVLQDGEAQAQVMVGASGMELIYRPAAFNPYTAGQGAILTLIYRGSDRWVVCGDMEAL
jgi:hypothetical protein